MAIKKTRTKQTRAAAPAENTRKLWLAGLGAVSIAQKQGAELLSDLIVEGNGVQAHAQKRVKALRADAHAQIKGAMAPVRAGLKKSAAKLVTAVQQGVATVLAKLGIPSRADIEELTHRVAALSRQLKTAK